MRCIARRVSDGNMLHLLKMWLKAPVEDTDERGHRRTSGGKKVTRGTPQGGVITPRTQKVTSVDSGILRTDRRRIAPVRRGRGNRDAVADHDRVIADEHVLDEQTHEALPFEDVQRIRRHSQPGEKR